MRSLFFIALLLVVFADMRVAAVWPPSTAFAEQMSSMFYGVVVLALVIGIAIGVIARRSNHEHK